MYQYLSTDSNAKEVPLSLMSGSAELFKSVTHDK